MCSNAVLPEFISFIHQLADAAGAVIRPYFRTHLIIDSKADESPVTRADREAETLMREMIRERYPDHGIWGEEFGREREEAKYSWVLDPVDGTKSFIAGIPLFGTLIALTRLGVPILGVIDQPINGERWLGAAPFGTLLGGAVQKTRACAGLAAAIISTTSPQLFSESEFGAFERVRAKARYTLYGHDCYAYAQVASGFIDAVIETGLKPHDFSALRPVVEQAGGIMTDWQGKPLHMQSSGQVVAAGDTRVHAEILALLAAS